jgi:hypothetical protein
VVAWWRLAHRTRPRLRAGAGPAQPELSLEDAARFAIDNGAGVEQFAAFLARRLYAINLYNSHHI